MGTDGKKGARLGRFTAFWAGPLDTRPLSLFRITFGVALVFALLDIAPVLFDLLSDGGVLPRGALLSGIARVDRVSVMDVAGPPWMSVLVLAAAVLAACCFTVGFHTRAATIASFVLVSGIHERNLAAFDGSDNVLRVMLFWLMFAPAGDHYSLDALRRPMAAGAPAGAPGAFTTRLVELQLSWIYLASALGKVRGETWRSGTALHYALSLEHLFTRRSGLALANLRGVTTLGTYGALGLEAVFLFLVWSPVFRRETRILAVVLGTGLHAGIALTMRVGNFSHLMVACYPLLLPPEWVEQVARRAGGAVGVGRLGRFFHEAPALAPRLWPRSARASGRVVLFSLFFCTVWFSIPRSARFRVPSQPLWVVSTLHVLELWQTWDMFAPDPVRVDFYLRGTGTLKDGTAVDVLHGKHGGPLPPEIPGFFFTRWTKFITNIAFADPAQLLPFGGFFCRRWNDGDGPPLMTFRIFRKERPIAPIGAPPFHWKERLIWDHHCF